MKQIFNNLRAILARHKESLPVVTLAEMLAEIDEAEAKREADCCVWKRVWDSEMILMQHKAGSYAMHDSNLKNYPYCQVCGKKIKVVE